MGIRLIIPEDGYIGETPFILRTIPRKDLTIIDFYDIIIFCVEDDFWRLVSCEKNKKRRN